MGSCTFHSAAATFHSAAATFHSAAATFHPAAAAITPGCQKLSTRLPPHYTRLLRHLHSVAATLHPATAASTRMYYIRKSAATIPLGCIAYGILTSDGRGERFNFHDQTYPDSQIALTRRISQQFYTMPRCSPEASRYVRHTSLDIYL